MRYVLDFGSANAGGHPSFTVFARVDTFTALTQPTIVESPDGQGQYYFDYDWTQAPAGVTSITYKATLNGIELSDVISGTPIPGVVSVTPGSPTLLGFVNAQTIVNRAAIQLGLLAPPLSSLGDPFASTNQAVGQLCDLAGTALSDINIEHEWPQLRKECTFLTVAGQPTYALPGDFHEMIDQSGWNRSSRLPLIGPLSPQEWQYLKARTLGMYISVVFRIDGGYIEINPGASVPGGITVAFEYIGENTVQSTTSSTGPDKNAPTIGTDTILFDPELVIAKLKLMWLTDRGFDTQKAEEAYQRNLEHCIGKSGGAPTLNLTAPGATAVDRFIDNANLPLTGYGS